MSRLAGAANARRPRPGPALHGLMAAGMLYAGYFVLRYGGLWTENDTARFTRDAVRLLSARSVFFPGEYVHGFGYPAWLGVLALVTGLHPVFLNAVVLPFVGMGLLLACAYLGFAALLGRPSWAALSAVLLLAVPEVTFTALRGNHEKLNLAVMLLTVHLVIASYRRPGGRARLAAGFGLILALSLLNAVVNDYFAAVFAMVLSGTALAVLVVPAGPRAARGRAALSWAVAAAAAWMALLAVMLWVYPPARHDLALLSQVLARLRDLAAGRGVRSNPYQTAADTWASPLVFHLLAVFRILMALGSFAALLVRARALLVARRAPTLEEVASGALYGGWALLVVAAIPVDFTGLAAGTNLEVRNFTYFAVFAAPLAGRGLAALLADVGSSRRARWRRRGIGALLAAMILGSAGKTTLDPLLSNQWLYYTPAERQALAGFWERSVRQGLWAGPDARLSNVAAEWLVSNPHENHIQGFSLTPALRDWLWSPGVGANIAAYGGLPPPYAAQNRVYDDGGAVIYRTAPKTPFQN